MAVDARFTRQLPKIELHAHLTGSISRDCLGDVWRMKKDKDPSLALQDPLVAMPVTGASDITTYTTNAVLASFQADNVIYLELRTTPRANPAHSITKSTYIATILSCIAAHNANPQSTLHASLILSIDRRNTLAEAHTVIDLALAHRAAGVVGVDLCGDPALGDVSIFRPVFQRAREAGLGITLHFAELAASASDAELFELLSWGPGRIGHVIHVKESIKDEIVRMGIGVELCLSCNVQLKMAGNEGGYREHHFGWWRNSGVGVALSTDDVGVFQSPLSEEYRLAAEHFDLGREDVKALCDGAVEMIFGGAGEKERLRLLYKEWDGWTG